jgi:hypothetical protein
MIWIRFFRVLIGLLSQRNVYILHWAIQESVTWRVRLAKIRTNCTAMARVSPISRITAKVWHSCAHWSGIALFYKHQVQLWAIKNLSLLVRNRLEQAIRITTLLDVAHSLLLWIEHYALETGWQINVYTSGPTLTDCNRELTWSVHLNFEVPSK